MTPRRRALIIVGLVLILIGIILFAVMLLRTVVTPPQAAPVTVEALPEAPEPEPVPEEFVNPLILAEKPDTGGTAARQMAEIFAERYGSYSNQGDYENLRDLLPIMTPRYRRATEAFLKSAEPPQGQVFEGVTSKKVSTRIRDIDDDSANIAVSLQQEKTAGDAASTIGYRTLRMELQLMGTDWRVDASSWEN